MDTHEMIAISIVVLASFLALRYFLRKQNGGCGGAGCLPGNRKKFEKKDTGSKSGKNQ